MERATEVVELSNGQTVVVQELNAMEVTTASLIANGKRPNDSIAMTAVAAVFAIAEIGGQKCERPRTFTDVEAFLSNLRVRDYNRILAAFHRLSGEAEGEAQAVEQQ